jgi:hypothetical protein
LLIWLAQTRYLIVFGGIEYAIRSYFLAFDTKQERDIDTTKAVLWNKPARDALRKLEVADANQRTLERL